MHWERIQIYFEFEISCEHNEDLIPSSICLCPRRAIHTRFITARIRHHQR